MNLTRRQDSKSIGSRTSVIAAHYSGCGGHTSDKERQDWAYRKCRPLSLLYVTDVRRLIGSARFDESFSQNVARPETALSDNGVSGDLSSMPGITRRNLSTELASISRNERIVADVCDGRRSRLTHDDLQFTPQQLDHRFNAFLAE